jgi:hypothetical protein
MSRKTKRRPEPIPLPTNLAEVMEEMERRFHNVMHRPAMPNDRVMYWSYCYSESEIKNQMIQTMLAAGIPQHLIYIFDRTGFSVTEQGFKRLSAEEKKEIRAAAREYQKLRKTNEQPIYDSTDYNDIDSNDADPLIHVLYTLGNFIDRNINSKQYTLDDQRFVCAYLVVRAFRIVRAIFRSQRFTTSEESLVLVRSLYEVYCKLCYAIKSKRNALYLFESDFGLAFGQYEFAQKNGRPNRNVLVHKKTRKEIPRTRSFYEYISSSPFPEDPELFSSLYEYLSSFVHSGSRHIFKAWPDRRTGFQLTTTNDENFKVFVSMLTGFVAAMIMQALLRLRNISSVSRWDIRLFCYATRHILIETTTTTGSEIFELYPKMKARAAVLPKNKPPRRLKD